jgi:hypothetical protein
LWWKQNLFNDATAALALPLCWHSLERHFVASNFAKYGILFRRLADQRYVPGILILTRTTMTISLSLRSAPLSRMGHS